MGLPPWLPLSPHLRPKLMPTTDTDTVVDTDTVDTADTTAVDTDTTEARGPLMPNPRLTLLPPLKPKLMPMLTTDTDTVDTTAVDTTDTDVLTDTTVDTVDTTDTLTDTDTTEARGPLKPKLHPKLMLTTDTDTVDTVMADMDTDTVMANKDIMVELLLKQTNKQTNPLNYNCQDQVTRNSFNLATMQIFPPPLFFLKHENSLFFPIELES